MKIIFTMHNANICLSFLVSCLIPIYCSLLREPNIELYIRVCVLVRVRSYSIFGPSPKSSGATHVVDLPHLHQSFSDPRINNNNNNHPLTFFSFSSYCLHSKMPTIPLHIRNPASPSSATSNPLPNLLHTPSGLALLELQGTINFPAPDPSAPSTSSLVGTLVFPHYDPAADKEDTKWMKRVYLYVGKNQRMSGEVRKLGRPFAVIRRVERDKDVDMDMDGVMRGGEAGHAGEDELEIVEVVRYKIVFSLRPEPVSVEGEEEDKDKV
jgi:chromosome transmission fidelity protein 8